MEKYIFIYKQKHNMLEIKIVLKDGISKMFKVSQKDNNEIVLLFEQDNEHTLTVK